jgi:hypothetical protein
MNCFEMLKTIFIIGPKSTYMKTLLLSLFLGLALLTTSSFKHNNHAAAPDPRNHVVGTYVGTYSTTIYYSKVPALGKADEAQNGEEKIVVTKSISAADALTLTEKATTAGSQDIVYQANGFTAGSNGAGFNLPDQTVTGKDFTATVNGTSSVKVGNLKFDGGYFSATKTISVAFQGTLNIPGEGGITYNIPYTTTFDVKKVK